MPTSQKKALPATNLVFFFWCAWGLTRTVGAREVWWCSESEMSVALLTLAACFLWHLVSQGSLTWYLPR